MVGLRAAWGELSRLRQRYGAGRVARYMVEAVLVGALYGFFKVLPLDAASAVGGWIMECIGPRLGRTRKTVLPQLEMAFPDKTPQARAAIMRKMWNNMGRVFAEYAHLAQIAAERMTVVGGEYLQTARQADRPVIFVAGHIGNWELMSVVIKNAGIPLHVVYRAPNNPWVGAVLHRARRVGADGRQIAKGASGARQILSVMRHKGAVGMLVDQRLTGGAKVNFFGRPAETAPAVALFADKYKAQVHYIRVERLSGAHFRVTVSPEVIVPSDQTVFLQQINDELERWVRVHPSQWLWTHRRWQA